MFVRFVVFIISIIIIQQFDFVQASFDYSSSRQRFLSLPKKNPIELVNDKGSVERLKKIQFPVHKILTSLRCGGEDNGDDPEKRDEDQLSANDPEFRTSDNHDDDDDDRMKSQNDKSKNTNPKNEASEKINKDEMKNETNEKDDNENLNEEYQALLRNDEIHFVKEANMLRNTFLRWTNENNRDNHQFKTEFHELSLARTDEYINDLIDFQHEQMELLLKSRDGKNNKKNKKQGPHPKKVLHFIAPKIPAIRQSPEFLLRIRSASATEDAGLAAFSIALIAGLAQFLDQVSSSITKKEQNESTKHKKSNDIISEEIIGDRRFEQLVECVLCGVDVKKRFKEFQELKSSSRQRKEVDSYSETSKYQTTLDFDGFENESLLTNNGDNTAKLNDDDTNEFDKDEDPQIYEGVTVCEAAQAAWGLSILGAHRLKSIGGRNPLHILVALSLRSRDLLLARLNLLRDFDDDNRSKDELKFEGTTTREIENEKMKQQQKFTASKNSLLNDIVSSIWAFSCVKECTALRNDYLLDACCTVLQQTETKLWDSRCQDMEARLDIGNKSDIQEEDIVDRLAMAEESESDDGEVLDNADSADNDKSSVEVDDQAELEENKVDVGTENDSVPKSTTDSEDLPFKDKMMLESLPPKYFVKVIWSLAIHGFSTEKDGGSSSYFTKKKFEAFCKKLKEQGTNLFQENLNIVLHNQNNPSDSTQHNMHDHRKMNKSTENLGNDEVDGRKVDVNQLEVVDAAKLIASDTVEIEKLDVPSEINVETSIDDTMNHSSENSHGDPAMITEKMTLNIESSEEGPIEVIDAAAILAAEAASADDKVTRKNTNTVEDNMNLKEGNDSGVPNKETKSVSDDVKKSKDDFNKNRNVPILEPLFSSQDLCTLTWSLAELDLLSLDAYNLILRTFEVSGLKDLENLQNVHLVNLIWSLAKYSDEYLHSFGAWEKAEASVLALSNSVAKILWKRLQSLESKTDLALDPTELSRLLWSMASLSSHLHFENCDDSNFQTYFSKITFFAVEYAGENISFFSSEDLARITWAYTACVTNDLEGQKLKLAKPFGVILSTIESSLIRWETGQLFIQQKNDNYAKKVKESVRFTPIFGQSRFSPLSLLNLNLFFDSEDDEEKSLSSNSSSALPLLGDLTIDPATLCKIAFGISCMASHDVNILHLNRIFLRITIRLLVAKQGQLLKECNYRDMVRLCVVCARVLGRNGIEVNNEDRDFILRNFPRRVLQVINESVTIESESMLNMLHYSDLASLLLSLGDLGVKAASFDEKDPQAYRKMRLVAALPPLEKERLEMLSPNLTCELFRGICSVGELQQIMPSLQCLCLDLENKIPSLDPDNLCNLAQSIVKLRYQLKDLRMRRKVADSKNDDKEHSDNERGGSSLENNKKAEKEMMTKVVSEIRQRHDASVDELFESCTKILSLIANTARDILPKFKANELHCLLQSFAMIPFQVDQFVEDVEREVYQRLGQMDSTSTVNDRTGVLDLVQNTANLANEASDCMASLVSSNKSTDGLLKTGMKTLLELTSISSKEKKDNDDDDDNNTLDWTEAETKLQQTVTAASMAIQRFHESNRQSGTDLDTMIHNFENGVIVDLGRCLELIAGYKRYDFQSHRRKSRFDDSRRKVVTNRLLGRLFL